MIGKGWVWSLMAVGMLSCPAVAGDKYASWAEAETLVAQVMVSMEKQRDETIQEINRQDGKWVSGDLYPVVYDMQGRVMAHGYNPRLVGRDLMGMKDTDGRYFVRERVKMAHKNQPFWQTYKFKDPLSGKVLPKETYCERQDRLIVCAGTYQRDALPK